MAPLPFDTIDPYPLGAPVVDMSQSTLPPPVLSGPGEDVSEAYHEGWKLGYDEALEEVRRGFVRFEE